MEIIRLLSKIFQLTFKNTLMTQMDGLVEVMRKLGRMIGVVLAMIQVKMEVALVMGHIGS